MFRFVNSSVVVPKKSVPVHRVIPVEQYSAQSFNINFAGWQMNDIGTLNRAQTFQQAQAILSRLVDVGTGTSNIPSNIPLKDCFNFIRPRYAQSELECLAFADAVGRYESEKIDDAYKQALSNVSLDKSSANSSVPADSSASVVDSQ